MLKSHGIVSLPTLVARIILYGPSRRSIVESVVASMSDFAVTVVGTGVGICAGFGLLGWTAGFLLDAAVLVAFVLVALGGSAREVVDDTPAGFISGAIVDVAFELVALEVGKAEMGSGGVTTFCTIANPSGRVIVAFGFVPSADN